ncbi:TetR/AcrR family transcriptional regulator [Promicromonospora sp. NPDC019610]|uniref:TetR/AcrR family transcriptional regulator n=1 Tax=Promicromonospora sp. NPDC019610 TaxID=3364405 RepID=UPI00378A6F5D
MASAHPSTAGEDPRFTRSRQAITDALAALLGQMGTYPSVAAVTQAAGVHRATFYNHFQSVEEAAVALIREDFRTLGTPEPGDRQQPGADPAAMALETLNTMLETLRQRRNVFLVASAWRSPSGLMGISDLLVDHVRELRRGLGGDDAGAETDDVEDVYAACGMNGVLSAAVSGSLGDRPEEITSRLHAALPAWMRQQSGPTR